MPYDSYGKSKKYAEYLLAARKNTKDFVPVTWGNPQPKSSITGDAESITHNFSQSQKNQFSIKGGEELSGIDLIKRGGGLVYRSHRGPVPSTSSVASLPFRKFVSFQYPDEWKKFSSSMRQCNDFKDFSDSELILHNSRINSEIKDEGDREKASEALKNLSEFLRDKKIHESPGIYYSILRADGDGIGSFIDKISKEKKSVDINRTFSKTLSQFSKEAGNLIESYGGYPVYTGGDDVLAFLPLGNAVQCSEALSGLFRDILKSGLKDFIPDDDIPTMSAGIAVVHHLSSLDDSLKLSAKAESEAKSVAGKNALCIILSKRGGSDISVKGSFNDTSRTADMNDLPALISEYIELFRDGSVPFGLPYELRELKTTLSGIEKKSVEAESNDTFEKIMESETERILKQKNITSDVIEKMKGMMDGKSPDSIDNYINLLIMARFFASESGSYPDGDDE